MAETSMEIPLDDDGFVRRECPHCERQFKWHHGPTDARPEHAEDPDVYVCPYCGETALHDQWWTREQLDHAQQLMSRLASQEIGDALEDINRRQPRDSWIKFELKRGGDPPPPTALHESNDMAIAQPPCHPWEPIKVSGDWDGPLHCLYCGASFAL